MTDAAWADYLRARSDLFELNFWVPSGRTFMDRASPDEPFLFKTERPRNQLVGGGFLVRFWELRVSEAWAAFGEGNGCVSGEQFRLAVLSAHDERCAVTGRTVPALDAAVAISCPVATSGWTSTTASG